MTSSLTTTIVTSYILRITKVQEMDSWNHSGALGSIQELNAIKKKLDRYTQDDKTIKGNASPLLPIRKDDITAILVRFLLDGFHHHL